jgi:hypothetical protein
LCKLAEQHRWQDPAGLDRKHHLHHVLPVGCNQIPVDGVGEELVDMSVFGLFGGAIENHVGPGAHPRHQRDAQKAAEAEDGFALAVRVGMQRVRLDLRAVFQKAVQDVDGFPDAAGDEGCEQRNIAVGDVVIGDAAIPAVADVSGAEQVVLTQRDMGTVGDRRLPLAPVSWQREA